MVPKWSLLPSSTVYVKIALRETEAKTTPSIYVYVLHLKIDQQ